MDPSIRILEKENNRRGDLFGRLMTDLFIALGYERPRLNVHKSGRELDLVAEHRLEARRAVAECKATSDSIGGDDLNKFVGAVDAEHDDRLPVTAYFVSLSGFKETAREQEQQRRRTKVILLTAPDVVNELIEGRILVARERAVEVAGRLCIVPKRLVLDDPPELLAHERGWIWTVYYGEGKQRTHFALIHSDGTVLARQIADEVMMTEAACGGRWRELVCVNPEPKAENVNINAALDAYRRYITEECGYIHLDGLPADGELVRRMRLENLFVPLRLSIEVPDGKPRICDVGATLADTSRIALLAAPGGGKSTLIKRLAVAYADPERRGLLADGLPERNWLPLFFRCRELRDLARGSFAELLNALAQREPVRQYAAAFRAHVDGALLAGRVLLLVDGLDEIADAGDRAAFVSTLRTALQAYPDVAIVVTSREAGFRHVAAHISSFCQRVALAPFNNDDIKRLTISWHQEVVGSAERVQRDAETLAKTIVENDRIKSLAVNPLLLTTLLLVKRWVGSLPTRRAVLYDKAVELLLMTWNVEGHDPIPEDEALPQLCYVAATMILEGLQKISRSRLAACLQEARGTLPTELGYVKESVERFIHRVEDRSSLLMMTGLDVESGRLVEFFEFRHLTFQEFLTARAMVEGWHPGRTETDTFVSVLEPHFEQESWREIIPLAAVLGGKKTEDLTQRLTQIVKQHGDAANILLNCLADEAPARPETVRAACRELVTHASSLIVRKQPLHLLARGRYGKDLRQEAGRAFLASPVELAVGDVLIACVWEQTTNGRDDHETLTHATNLFRQMVSSEAQLTRCEGTVGLGHAAYLWSKTEAPREITELLSGSREVLISMLVTRNESEIIAACYALETIAANTQTRDEPSPKLLRGLVELWFGAYLPAIKVLAARAFAAQPLRDRDDSVIADLFRGFDVPETNWRESPGERLFEAPALILSWYLRTSSDIEIRDRIESADRFAQTVARATLKDLAVRLKNAQSRRTSRKRIKKRKS